MDDADKALYDSAKELLDRFSLTGVAAAPLRQMAKRLDKRMSSTRKGADANVNVLVELSSLNEQLSAALTFVTATPESLPDAMALAALPPLSAAAKESAKEKVGTFRLAQWLQDPSSRDTWAALVNYDNTFVGHKKIMWAAAKEMERGQDKKKPFVLACVEELGEKNAETMSAVKLFLTIMKATTTSDNAVLLAAVTECKKGVSECGKFLKHLAPTRLAEAQLLE
jgi:hypothetical protein